MLRVAAAAALVVTVALAGSTPPLTRSTPPIMTRRLANGLTLILVEDHRAPLASVVTMHRIGSADDPPGRAGLAHLLEHALVEGAPPPPRGSMQAGSLFTEGITSFDDTTYRVEVRSGEVALALWYAARRLTAFDDPAAIERVLPTARASVINEKEGRAERWALHAATRRQVVAMLGAGHPYAAALGSGVATARTATVAELAAEHRRGYGPGNTVIAVVGDIDAGAVGDLGEKILGPVPPGPPFARASAPPLPAGGARLEAVADVARPMAIITYPLPPRFSDGDAEVSLLPAVLDAPAGGLLRQRLAREQGLAEAVSVDAIHGRVARGEHDRPARRERCPAAGRP